MKIKSTYYVEVIDTLGGTLRYGGPPVPVNSRYAIDTMSDGMIRPMVEFVNRYPGPMITEIMKSPHNSEGTFGQYEWKKS
jgi:hypothetical protein